MSGSGVYVRVEGWFSWKSGIGRGGLISRIFDGLARVPGNVTIVDRNERLATLACMNTNN